jgi:hypothetical protein|tara:strand:- start:1509 stop:1973 length:465 start_codon:yes stop_codon:yes gene_type:complete
MPIKTFRGLIAHDSIDTVVLHTQNGSTGYRIVELDIMYNTPGVGDVDHILQVFSVPQTAASGVVDFSDQTLLGAAFLRQDAEAANITGRMGEHVIFDNIVFNQDIYITLKNVHATGGSPSTLGCNYLIKLEQVKLDLTQNTVATLKDIRNIEQP